MRRPCCVPSQRAFSVVELLVVVALAAVLLTLAVSASLGKRDHLAVDTAAKHFSGFIKKARLIARENKAPVRLVFIPQTLIDPASPPTAEPEYVECVLYEFIIPRGAHREVTWREAANSETVRGGDALERIPVSIPGLPESLVGRWKRVATKPMRLRKDFSHPVQMKSAILEEFSPDSAEEFYAGHTCQPFEFWEAGPTPSGSGRSASSPYPKDYCRTPFPQDYPLITGPLPAEEQIYDPQRRSWRPVGDFWPASEKMQHFNTRADIKMQDLPFIEFDSRGEIRAPSQEKWEFEFAIPDRPDVSTVVRLDPASGSLALATALP